MEEELKTQEEQPAEEMVKAKTTEEIAAEQEEVYKLNYIMRDNTININVYEGGQVVFQSGIPKSGPPY